MVTVGLEQVIIRPEYLAHAGRLGLLYNQASVDRQFRSAPELIAEVYGDRFRAL